MNEYSLKNIVKTIIVHILTIVCIYLGDFNYTTVTLFLFSYYLRLFGVSAGYHRLFSHRAFETSRFFQFILAFLGASTGQRGPLSWSTSHIIHHQHADKDGDPHSPQVDSFFYSHLGWVLKKEALPTDTRLSRIKYFSKYPEIVFINKYHSLPSLGLIVFLYLGNLFLSSFFPNLSLDLASLFGYGFFLPTLVILHGTCLINSLGHLHGARRFETKDESRNIPWLWPLAVGENWHNNHHQNPNSASNSNAWWELDLIYSALVFLEWLGIVRNLKK